VIGLIGSLVAAAALEIKGYSPAIA